MLTFKPGGWFSGDSDLHCVEGFIMDKDKRKLAFLYGKWTEFLCSASPESLASLLGCNLAKVMMMMKVMMIVMMIIMMVMMMMMMITMIIMMMTSLR